MYILLVNIHVKPECVDAFIKATRENARASVQEPGCLRFDVIQEVENPAQFKLYEVYRDEAAAAAHKQTPHYAAWAEVAPPMMVEPRTRAIYRNCIPSDAEWR